MKKLIALFAGMFLITLSANVIAQNSATVNNVNAAAKIIAPIALTNTTNLDFGTITKTADGGDVTLNVALDGTVTRTFENTAAAAVTLGSANSATFNVSGEKSALYSITLPADNTIELTGPSGATAMKLKTFTSTVPVTGGVLSAAAGTQTFYVGATLDVNANQIPGDYTGTFAVTVTYN